MRGKPTLLITSIRTYILPVWHDLSSPREHPGCREDGSPVPTYSHPFPHFVPTAGTGPVTGGMGCGVTVPRPPSALAPHPPPRREAHATSDGRVTLWAFCPITRAEPPTRLSFRGFIRAGPWAVC